LLQFVPGLHSAWFCSDRVDGDRYTRLECPLWEASKFHSHGRRQQNIEQSCRGVNPHEFKRSRDNTCLITPVIFCGFVKSYAGSRARCRRQDSYRSLLSPGPVMRDWPSVETSDYPPYTVLHELDVGRSTKRPVRISCLRHERDWAAYELTKPQNQGRKSGKYCRVTRLNS